MNKWRLTLDSGHSLRAAIFAASHATEEIAEMQAHVLDALERCVEECIEKLPEHELFDFEEFQGTIAGEADYVRKRDTFIQEMGFDSAEGLIDNRLDQFYDLCDLHKVWVGLD